MTDRQDREARGTVWLLALLVGLMVAAWAFGTPTFFDWPWLVD